MTPEQKQLVQTSFAQVQPIADTAAALFYGRLFTLDPKLQPLFKGDLREQGKKLMHMLGLAVRGLDRLEGLVPMLHQLGARHVGYGVTEGDYETVAAALLWTLAQGLGDAFTPEVRDAWTAVYALLAETMKAGAATASETVEAAAAGKDPTSTGKGEHAPAPSATPALEGARMCETSRPYQRTTDGFATTLADRSAP